MKCPIAPFKPEEFFAGKIVSCRDAAHIANAILEAGWAEACKQAVEVRRSNNNSEARGWYEGEKATDTHRAFLFGIEELNP